MWLLWRDWTSRTLLLRPCRGAEYFDQPTCLCVCLSVCVSVCPRAYLWNRWTNRHEMLCADPLWPWLGPHTSQKLLKFRLTDKLYHWHDSYVKLIQHTHCFILILLTLNKHCMLPFLCNYWILITLIVILLVIATWQWSMKLLLFFCYC